MWAVWRADLADKAANRQRELRVNSQLAIIFITIPLGPLKNSNGGERIKNFSVVDITVV